MQCAGWRNRDSGVGSPILQVVKRDIGMIHSCHAVFTDNAARIDNPFEVVNMGNVIKDFLGGGSHTLI